MDANKRDKDVPESEPFSKTEIRADDVNSKVKIYLIVICILCLIIVTIATVLITTMQELRSFGHPDGKVPQQCFPCSVLETDGLKTSAEDRHLYSQLSKSVVNGERRCCGRGYGQVSGMFELILTKQKSLQRYIRNVSVASASDFVFTSVSVHKNLMSSKDTGPDDGNTLRTLYLNTTYNKPLTEHIRGVKVQPQGITILYSGIYYIYSSVLFTSDSKSICVMPNRMKHFLNCLVRRNPSKMGSDILLTTESSCCENCSVEFNTKYTGGVFFLAKDDLIQSEISAEGEGFVSSKSSFIGLFMLGTDTSNDGPGEFNMAA